MGKCFHTATVTAPIDQVWATLSNFHDMDWAAGVVESCEKVGEVAATEVGARRLLNGAIHETLASVDAANHRSTYTIDDGPGPISKDAVTNYTGAVKLTPITSGGGTFVQWTSEYESTNDGAVGEFCNPIYGALLGCLQKTFGT